MPSWVDSRKKTLSESLPEARSDPILLTAPPALLLALGKAVEMTIVEAIADFVEKDMNAMRTSSVPSSGAFLNA